MCMGGRGKGEGGGGGQTDKRGMLEDTEPVKREEGGKQEKCESTKAIYMCTTCTITIR